MAATEGPTGGGTPRRLYLVRHGETTGGSSIRYYGRTDVPLSDLGRAQVERLAALVRDLEVEALVHSPLARAVESARILSRLLRRPPPVVEAHAGLAEVDFGELEGMTEDEIRAARPGWFRAWRAAEVEGYPGGETLAGFAARIAGATDEVLARWPQGDLLVVVHRGVIKMVLAHLLGEPRAAVRPWPLDLGSLSCLVRRERWEIERYNVIPG